MHHMGDTIESKQESVGPWWGTILIFLTSVAVRNSFPPESSMQSTSSPMATRWVTVLPVGVLFTSKSDRHKLLHINHITVRFSVATLHIRLNLLATLRKETTGTESTYLLKIRSMDHLTASEFFGLHSIVARGFYGIARDHRH